MKKIYLCSDFIMTNEKEQASNRRWVVDLLTRPIFKATGIEPDSFFSSLTRDNIFSRIKFFELSNINLDIEKTQFLFDETQISDESLEYLQSYITPNILLIGYEFSRETRYILDKIGVTYIDFWLHPVRFLDDLLFAFYSNNKKVYSKFEEFKINDEYFYNYGTKIKIQNYKGWRRSNLPIMPNSAVFFGQTLEDKAVSRKGKMLNILDFKDEIEKITNKYSVLYYVRHPYLKKGDEEILKYVKNHPKIKMVDFPAYDLLANQNIKEVVSISSSLVHEAKYFEKENTFLYQSILEFGSDFNKKEYMPVYQDFISVYFWSKVLSPLLNTTGCEKITYLDEKDKIRDMLNFYWSYKQVDKVEQMRGTLSAVDRLLQSHIKVTKGNNSGKKEKIKKVQSVVNGISPEKSLEKLFLEIDKHDVISFDIFDTLLTRPFAEPSDIFNYMESEVREKFSLDEFPQLRMKARGLVKDVDSEEINLDLRYQALAKNHPDLNEEEALKLEQLELKYEKRYLNLRKFNYELYSYALKKKKKVVITSDTFYSREFIVDVLSDNGINDYDELFLSSEQKFLKHTGNLFPIVMKKMNVRPEKMLHIGDNKHADIAMAKKHGISTLYIPRTMDDFKTKSLLLDHIKYSNNVFNSISKGLIVQELSDAPWDFDTPSFINGNAYNFGFGIVGSIFTSFVKSLIEKSIEDGIEILFFMSRDGEIIKKVYDLYAPLYDNAPKSEYVYASRRSLNVCSIFETEDAMRIMDKKFSPCTVKNIFKNRFGVSVPDDLIKEAGFDHQHSRLDYFKDMDKAKKLIELASDIILTRASHERGLLLEHYKTHGLEKNDKLLGIVDIGHEGSLQKAINSLLDIKINGYYFATFPEIGNNVESLGMNTWGYVGNKISDNNHFYRKNILMFENLFLNSAGSFLYMDNISGNPVELSTYDEQKRVLFASEMQKGIIEFNVRMKKTLGSNFIDLPQENVVDVCTPYLKFLENPTLVDLKMFINMGFENSYNCRDMKFLIQLAKEKGLADEVESIWKKGAHTYNLYKKVEGNWFEINLLSTRQKKLIKKFKNNPYGFFADSKYPLIRVIGKIFYS